MILLKGILYQKKIKNLQQEIQFVKPLQLYMSDQFRWFELNWRLVRRYVYYSENWLGIDLDSRDQQYEISENTTCFFITILDHIDRNINAIATYCSENKQLKKFKKIDFKFFEDYLEIIPKMSNQSRAVIYKRTMTHNILNTYCTMLYFYSELLVRIQRIEYSIYELNSLLRKRS